jgi:Protein of unknown function (DUF4038)/Putative collagen-binding domain of a collagenase
MKILCFLLIAGLLFHSNGLSQSGWKHGRLKTTTDGHYLEYEDGTPFFWLGDTGWELFHRLRLEEATNYLENRRRKGFNVIQAVILAEFNGLKKPDQYGQVPLRDLDPSKPNEVYFRWVDTVIRIALKKNIFMAILPTWGDKVTLAWGEGPVIFNPDNAYVYGKWLGNRYQQYPNIIWMLGGDRPPKNDSADWTPVWRAMAKGILEGSKGKAIFTYHISGGPKSTSQYIHHEPWLAINTMQSGHGSGHDVPVWTWVERDRNLVPAKPTLDAEPNYEDHPVNPWPSWDSTNGYFSAYDVRKQCYRSVFAGACGVTYGHHSVWQFWSAREAKVNHADCYWTDAIDRPGAFQVGYLKNLIESRPQFNRVPDQELLAAGQGEKGEYICIIRSPDSSTAMFYLPYGKEIAVRTGFIKSAKLLAWWFNPKNGHAIKIGLLKKENTMSFIPPSIGYLNDWVLVLDNPNAHFGVPGIKTLYK